MHGGVGGCLFNQEQIGLFADGDREGKTRTSVLQMTSIFTELCISDEQCFVKEGNTSSCLWQQLGCHPWNNQIRITQIHVSLQPHPRKAIRVS